MDRDYEEIKYVISTYIGRFDKVESEIKSLRAVMTGIVHMAARLHKENEMLRRDILYWRNK